MELSTVWFLLIAVLWLGYFILEGFDFGVGMLLPILGRKDKDRRVMINTIGPVWDGNEVWLLTAGGATFAAFPEWYASLFSGLYLPLLLILAALIVRGVAFEYRAKRDDVKWKSRLDLCIIIGSFVPSLVWGVGFANFVRGLPLNENRIIEGTAANFFGLFTPFALLGGLLTVALFLTHGAVFISLKTLGDIRDRARAFAKKSGLVALILVAAFGIWMSAAYGKGILSWLLAVVAIAGIALSWLFIGRAREGWAFVFTAVTIFATFVGIFVSMYPNAIKSSLNPAWSLTVADAASTPYTLTIMTIAAGIFTPIVLLYQGWTYWVFRRRISAEVLPEGAH